MPEKAARNEPTDGFITSPLTCRQIVYRLLLIPLPLYGEDPDHRPDIYGKVGNSGVSICCLDDAKKLYSGFDLSDPKTSVSMTINGPAATMLLGFFMNAAIDQQCEKYIRENNLENLVKAKLRQKLYESDQNLARPQYRGEIA